MYKSWRLGKLESDSRPPTKKNCPSQNVNNAKTEKP